MSWVIKGSQYIPTVIGEPFGGGYFAGYISHTADGNPTHALIIAPKVTGQTGTALQWKTSNTATPNTDSDYDGASNTAAIVTAGINDHPAAKFCVDLSIGGFTDWYLPSRYELDIAYFNIKPGAQANNTDWGVNAYSVPRRISNNSLTYPAQTSIGIFAFPNTESFNIDNYWSSTEASASAPWFLGFNSGIQAASVGKTGNRLVRAFRRIAL